MILKLRYIVSGKAKTAKVTIFKDGDRLVFKSMQPFEFKDEIKAMEGWKFDWDAKQWSIADTYRNHFQLQAMMGKDVYAPWDKPIQHFPPNRGPDWGPDWFKGPMKHQQEMIDFALTRRYCNLAVEMGLGKGLSKCSLVYTPTGTTTFGEIKIGDEIIDPDGGTCEVTGVFPRGKMEMFKVTFTDGESVVVSGDHLWRVITPTRKYRGQDWEVVETQELVQRGLQHKSGNNKWFIPMVEPVDFKEQELGCHPYVMGYLLGNGCMPLKSVSIPDQETVERLNSFMDEPLEPKPSTLRGEKIDYYVRCPRTRGAIDHYELEECRAPDKFVPQEFLFNSVENRLFLLQGLLDSDGSYLDTAGVEYGSASKELAKQVLWLIQSFGGTGHLGFKEEPTYTYKGEKRVGLPCHRVHGSFKSTIKPFLLSRKAERYTVPSKYEPTRAIVSIESVGEDDCICIRVDSPSRCYVTDSFIVTHNTFSMIEVIEQSGITDWWWIAPKSGMESLDRELKKWGMDPTIRLRTFTYEALREFVKNEWPNGKVFPQGIIFDECRKLSNPRTNWTIASQAVADNIRHKYGWDGMVVTMSGTTNAESPVDIWSQIEVTWPGFLREGSRVAFEYRLGIFRPREDATGGTFQERVCMLDDSDKCRTCGQFKENHPTPDGCKRWRKSVNEVAMVAKRLEGIQLVQKKEDCLDLPEKRYREVTVKPSASTLRAARAMARAAPNTITGLNWLRQLSDGFAYKPSKGELITCRVCHGTGERKNFVSEEDTTNQTQIKYSSKQIECEECGGSGTSQKNDRRTTKVPCPKDDALRELLAENYEHGRICVFASYHGSVDRCEEVCLSEGWHVFKVDGRGWRIKTLEGTKIGVDCLDYWSNTITNKRVAFVAHPKSGGMGLTLTEARTAVYYSNPYSADDRLQSEDRIHRIGSDPNRGVEIVDIIHLESDRMVKDALLNKKKLEKMSLGILDFGDEDEQEAAESESG